MRFRTTPPPPAPPAALQEVEFALVLSNIIESLKNDPSQLRSTVYELARVKLQGQLVNLDASDAERLTRSLEVAIRGVEDFSIRKDNPDSLRQISPTVRSGVLLPPAARSAADQATAISAERKRYINSPRIAEGLPVSEPSGLPVGSRSPSGPRNWQTTYTLLFAAAAVLTLAVIAYHQVESVRQHSLVRTNETTDLHNGDSQLASGTPNLAVPAAVRPPIFAASPLPTTFGVYAVSANRLFELEALPIRAPDRRIAMSAAINTPSRTTLPDGKIRFIVFRRDSSINAIERPEVRVVAKVARAVSFEEGKATVSDRDDNWILRNISREFKAAPVKDNPEMYEILDESDEALSAGRYALVLRGQAYDFTVEGTVTDLNQCLERTTAANGSFLSECRKP